MRKALLFSALVFCAASPVAADTTHCDAKPFTLGKPAAAAAKPEKPSTKQQVKAGPAAKKTQPRTEAKAKPTLLAPCKDKTKKSS
jgi:hypothetical protein